MKQRTLRSPAVVSGAGLHTGLEVTLTLKPAEENSGIRFKRTDLEGVPEIEAVADYVKDTHRGTSLEKNGVKVSTIEHVMAALAGLQIDNCTIEINAPETPITDGSARFFTEAILQAGIIEQQAEKKFLVIEEVIRHQDKATGSEYIVLPDEKFRITTMIDFDSKVLGMQHASLESIEDFAKEIAPCRTFVFLHELEILLHKNLIKGGDLSNAIVFVNKPVTQEELDRLAALFNKPSVAVKSEGILNNLELYFPNEPARHKLLDVIGDLALVGAPIQGQIIANRPGHGPNTQLAAILRKYLLNRKAEHSIPRYDPNKPALFEVRDIMRFLPHRPPFLLIDKIIELTENYVIGIKAVTMNESFFVGHFPDEPVMPGVLQIEAMAQTGGILALNTIDDPENYLTYFLKIDNVKFRNKVVPGDTLVFKLSLISPIRRGLCHMKGVAYVGNKIVMEASMLAQIIKKSQ